MLLSKGVSLVCNVYQNQPYCIGFLHVYGLTVYLKVIPIRKIIWGEKKKNTFILEARMEELGKMHR